MSKPRPETELEWRKDLLGRIARLERRGRGSPPRPIAVPTTERPALADVSTGTQVFDTTLHRPIWADGTRWVDAAGNPI